MSKLALLAKLGHRDWWKYLSLKVPLPDNGFERIRAMRPGMALVFAQGTDLHRRRQQLNGGVQEDDGEERAPESFVCYVRDRITRDRGRSRLNDKRRSIPQVRSRSASFAE